jgi:hypothetical protein
MQSLHSSMYLEMINIEREEQVARGQRIRTVSAHKVTRSHFHSIRDVTSRTLISIAEKVRPAELPAMPHGHHDDAEWVQLAR